MTPTKYVCGHTHGEGRCQPRENLVVHTEAARYGEPEFQMFEFE